MALVGLVLVVAAFVVVRLLMGIVAYPLRVASPDVAGIIASKSTNEFDAPEVRLVLTSGHEVILHRDDRTLIGGVGEGDLIVFGSTPERWYIVGSPRSGSDRPGCYSFSANRAYSETDGVVLVWYRWLGQGIRLPKAPGYDDSGLLYEIFGHLEYRQFEWGSGVSFCLDDQGRVTEFTH